MFMLIAGLCIIFDPSRIFIAFFPKPTFFTIHNKASLSVIKVLVPVKISTKLIKRFVNLKFLLFEMFSLSKHFF